MEDLDIDFSLCSDDEGNLFWKGKYWELAPEYAHSNAAKLLDQDLFWSGIDDISPFGHSDGYDSLTSYLCWRQKNWESSAIVFLHNEIIAYGYSTQFLDETNLEKLNELYDSYQLTYITHDEIIIATAFAQFILEGKMEQDLLNLAKIAAQRQLNPYIIELWAPRAKEKRKHIVESMADVLSKISGLP